jgi:hypothetical protein
LKGESCIAVVHSILAAPTCHCYAKVSIMSRTKLERELRGRNQDIRRNAEMGQSFVSHDTTPGVTATNDNSTPQAGPGLLAKSAAAGVIGESTTWHGVYGTTQSTTGGVGVMGEAGGTGVIGKSQTWMGVYGTTQSTTGGAGVMGEAEGTGVIGKSKTWMGVYGNSQSTTGGAGVMGEATGPGVIGKSQSWHGVYGETQSTTGGAGVWGEHKSNGSGVVGKSNSGVGVWGQSDAFEGVHAESNSPTTAAIAAYAVNPNGTGAAIYAESRSRGPAGFFKGDVLITGDIKLINGDCAEEFTIGVGAVEPGTVMVLGDEGALFPSAKSHDRRVAGVIAGAGDFKPGIILDKQSSAGNRQPVALFGKTFCKVDAGYGSIEIGDLLTTSDTPGHAMRASDPAKAFGAVIGKALCSLHSGKGLIPILIALQ